jgi:hypothetical protein
MELAAVLDVLAGVKAKDKEFFVSAVTSLQAMSKPARKRIITALTKIFG